MHTFRFREVLTFVGLAVGLGWLVALPIWLDDRHLQAPWAFVLTVVFMFTPALALVGVHFLFRPGDLREGIGLGWGTRRIGLWVLAIAVPLGVTLASMALAHLTGVYRMDLVEFSALHKIIVDAGGGEVFDEVPIQLLAVALIPQVLLGSVINALAAIGEEVGWRGYLFPRLQAVSTPFALVAGGIIWGLWHAPLILLGHNYPNAPVLGVFAFCITCVLLGIGLSALRLATNSIWPAALAHGAVNASAGLTAAYASLSMDVDALAVGVTGWTGWVVLTAVALLILWRTSVFRSRSGEPA